MSAITFQEASCLLRYDEATGAFHWLVTRGNRHKAGKLAGTVNKGGYVKIGINRRYYMAHRLAWLFTYGEWPNGVVDHINGDTSDNRICNLRSATQAENSRNQRISKNNSSGFKGVHWHARRQKWAASIRSNWKLHHLGYFDVPEDASRAYDEASVLLHGEFGKPSFKALLTPSKEKVETAP